MLCVTVLFLFETIQSGCALKPSTKRRDSDLDHGGNAPP